MPLFHLPVFWFGYFDGFKTLSKLWLLYPGGAVGRRCAHDRDADDPQDLRLCVDGPDRLFRHEKRVQVKENEP